MPKIPDDKKDLPSVTLGGEDWAVAPMSARKIIRFGSIAMGLDLSKQSGDTLASLYECCWLAISTVHKDVTLDNFLDDYHVTFDEGIASFEKIAKAAGMEFKAVKPGEAKAPPSVENNSSTDGTIS
jgi:hypothetical protein